MTDTDTDTDSEPTEYRLQDDIDQVVRAGLVLKGDQTVTLAPDEAAAHDDVLKPVDGDDSSSDDGEDST